MTFNNSWESDKSPESSESSKDSRVMASSESMSQGEDFANVVDTRIAPTAAEEMVEAGPKESRQSSEIRALRSKMKTLERNVDARLAYLEDDNESSGERLTKLEMEARAQDNGGIEALQAKMIQLQRQVDQLVTEGQLQERVKQTTASDGKAKTIGSSEVPAKKQPTIANRARTGNQITTSLNNQASLNEHTSWYLYAIPCMGIVWLLVAVMVAAFAAVDNDPDLFASSVKDGAKVLGLLLLWMVLVSYKKKITEEEEEGKDILF